MNAFFEGLQCLHDVMHFVGTVDLHGFKKRTFFLPHLRNIIPQKNHLCDTSCQSFDFETNPFPYLICTFLPKEMQCNK